MLLIPRLYSPPRCYGCCLKQQVSFRRVQCDPLVLNLLQHALFRCGVGVIFVNFLGCGASL